MQHAYNAPLGYADLEESWYRYRLWRRGEMSTGEYSWRNPLMPVLYVFNLLGRIPFYRDKEDSNLKIKVLSFPILWAVVSNCTQITFVTGIYYWKLSDSRYWRNFDVSLISVNELIILNSSFHGLEATWAATPAIVRAINRWEAYHRRLYTLVRSPVSSKLLEHSYVGMVLIILPSIQILILHLFMGEVTSTFHVIKEIVYCLCFYYNLLVFWLWMIVCSLVIKTGDTLKNSLMQSTAVLPIPEVFCLYRDLWLELHACSKDMASALATTLISWKVLLFTAVLLGTYAIVVYIKTHNYTLLVTYIIAVSCIHIVGYETYSYGYFSQQAVSQNILEAIMSRRWVHLSRRCTTELELLIESVQMGKPCFEMRGLFIFDRRTHITVFQLLITYLVVVVQLNEQSSK